MTPSFALAKGQSPEDAAAKRAQIEAGLAEDPQIAVAALRSAGEEFGDPELFLLAATRARDEAQSSRDAALALQAESLALTAQDIGSHLADSDNYDATDWRPVSRERAPELAAEAGDLADQAHALAEEIEAEQAAAAAAAERARLAALEEEPKPGLKPGTGLVIGGSAALVLGAGGIGLLGAGIAMGQARQREAEALDLPAEIARLEELDRQGATSNTLAIVGGVVAGVGVGVGVALIVLGVKKRKASGGTGEQAMTMGGWFSSDGAGLALQGSF